MEFTCEQLVDSFTKRYIEDVGYKTYNELFAIFDIVMKEYQKDNECPICKNNGQYRYNNAYIGCSLGIFAVQNDIVSFAMRVNYCPMCGKRIS